jgi:DNA polymerase III subunit gamma/tau
MTPLLNLARKWRSQQFDQIVGQAITVRILKNTLYSNHYFPVYLFSGHKGCGKTSTARIFAGAINCEKLPEFQKNPRSIILPCLECASCRAMTQLQHPDFIEIDAASHTGVDNVRTIIDAASLLPILGTRKIYLIDEAHMLSKSAFNAFLKILEEPPASVLFILATTDPHKIIDTVRSRCFQLFFDPLVPEQLATHLEIICKTEQINADSEALLLIAQESMGCVRDALNLLEQLRFGHTHITAEVVTHNLGYIALTKLTELFTYIIDGSVTKIIQWIEEHNDNLRSPLTVWAQCKNHIRKLLLDSHNNQTQNILINCLRIAYDYELTLQKSTQQQGLLELMLIEMGQCHERKQQTQQTPPSTGTYTSTPLKKEPSVEEIPAKAQPQISSNSSVSHEWKSFLNEIETLSDPLLSSIFKQAVYKNQSTEPLQVAIEIAQNSPFFKEWITDTEKIWSPLLEKQFGKGTELIITYLEALQNKQTITRSTHAQEKPTLSTHTTKKNNPIDISDKTVWKNTHTLIEAFGGTITESNDDQKIT